MRELQYLLYGVARLWYQIFFPENNFLAILTVKIKKTNLIIKIPFPQEVSGQ